MTLWLLWVVSVWFVVVLVSIVLASRLEADADLVVRVAVLVLVYRSGRTMCGASMFKKLELVVNAAMIESRVVL